MRGFANYKRNYNVNMHFKQPSAEIKLIHLTFPILFVRPTGCQNVKTSSNSGYRGEYVTLSFSHYTLGNVIHFLYSWFQQERDGLGHVKTCHGLWSYIHEAYILSCLTAHKLG